MAKLTKQQELNLVADWKTGAYSQRDLSDKYNCSKGKVSQLTQGVEKAKNGHLLTAQMSILSAQSELPKEEMTAIMTTAQKMAYNQGLVFNPAQKLLKLVESKIDNNVKYEKVNAGNGVQNLEPTELESGDFKNLADTIDKASVTLGVNPRFSNTQPSTENEPDIIEVEIE